MAARADRPARLRPVTDLAARFLHFLATAVGRLPGRAAHVPTASLHCRRGAGANGPVVRANLERRTLTASLAREGLRARICALTTLEAICSRAALADSPARPRNLASILNRWHRPFTPRSPRQGLIVSAASLAFGNANQALRPHGRSRPSTPPESRIGRASAPRAARTSMPIADPFGSEGPAIPSCSAAAGGASPGSCRTINLRRANGEFAPFFVIPRDRSSLATRSAHRATPIAYLQPSESDAGPCSRCTSKHGPSRRGVAALKDAVERVALGDPAHPGRPALLDPRAGITIRQSHFPTATLLGARDALTTSPSMTAPVPEAEPAPQHFTSDWRPLPPRARSLFMLSHASMGLLVAIPVAIVSASTHYFPIIPAVLVALAIGGLGGAWLGAKRFRSKAWRLDDDGFGYRRGRLFHRETRGRPRAWQHIDLKHGPFERHWKLATSSSTPRAEDEPVSGRAWMPTTPKPSATLAAIDALTPSESRRLHPGRGCSCCCTVARSSCAHGNVLFKGDRNELWPLIGVGILHLTSHCKYLTYRWQVGADA